MQGVLHSLEQKNNNQESSLHPVELAKLRVENASLQKGIDQAKNDMHAQKCATAKSNQVNLACLHITWSVLSDLDQFNCKDADTSVCTVSALDERKFRGPNAISNW